MEIDLNIIDAQVRHATNWKNLLLKFRGLEGNLKDRADYAHLDMAISASDSGAEYVVAAANLPVVFTMMYTGNDVAKIVCTTANPFDLTERLHVLTFTLNTSGMTDFTSRATSLLNLQDWAFHIQAIVMEKAVAVRAAKIAEFEAR